jgi:hypothetical protein
VKALNARRKKPSDGATHWSCSNLADVLRINNPDFEKQAADRIGLCLSDPQHGSVFCVAEKSFLQALDLLDPVLPLSPGRAERLGFEYCRHGTLSFYAALGTRAGKVFGKTATRYASVEFVRFLTEWVSSRPARQAIHFILNNLSAHKTTIVKGFLEDHANVDLHFTPTCSSWLNQVGIRFSLIEREVIWRGVFSSVPDLARKLLCFTRVYSDHAKLVKWKDSYPSRHIGDRLFATWHQAGS